MKQMRKPLRGNGPRSARVIRPLLEALEDRLPPGDTILGALVAQRWLEPQRLGPPHLADSVAAVSRSSAQAADWRLAPAASTAASGPYLQSQEPTNLPAIAKPAHAAAVLNVAPPWLETTWDWAEDPLPEAFPAQRTGSLLLGWANAEITTLGGGKTYAENTATPGLISAPVPPGASASSYPALLDDLATPRMTEMRGLQGIVAPISPAQQTTAVGDGTGGDGADGPHRERIILHQDMVLERTWHLDSSTLLDCRGHRISAKSVGTPDDTTTKENEFVPSVPEVGIYLNAARGVTVQNCVIDGFDFGIEVANAKVPPESRHHDRLVNRFLRNTISGWFPIQVVGADDNLIEGNTVTYGQGARGVGIQVWADSDRNIIRNNTVLGRSIEENTQAPIFPGWRLGQFRPDGVALLVGTQVQRVINIIIDGRLQQILTDDVGRQDDNVVEGNYVDADSSLSRDIGAGENRFLRVEGNEIHRGWQGVHFSGQGLGTSFRLPGYCTRDPSRYGDDDGYCFIPGIDKEDLGPLVPGKLVTTEGGVEHGLIRGNRILGPFTGAGTTLDDATGPDAVFVAPNPLYPVIEDNEIAGSARAGVRLGTNAIETAVVQRNVIHDNAYGVLLVAFPPPFYPLRFFGATISLNDITGSSRRAVGNSTTPLYDLASELSDAGTLQGNYWGRTCEDGNGFRPFNPEDPNYGDSLRTDILDSHAYGEPVAGRHRLPATCQ